MYEVLESTAGVSADQTISSEKLLRQRSWSPARLQREIRRAQRARLLKSADGQICFTKQGFDEAARLTRQHRLWELYLITYADVAPGQVDRDADAIEHVLEPEVVAELESLLEQEDAAVPASPHRLEK